MSLEVDSEEFKNVKFIMRDSYKFLAKSLKKLCESFKIPKEYTKSEMDHNAVNEANWQELKPIWEPLRSCFNANTQPSLCSAESAPEIWP